MQGFHRTRLTFAHYFHDRPQDLSHLQAEFYLVASLDHKDRLDAGLL